MLDLDDAVAKAMAVVVIKSGTTDKTAGETSRRMSFAIAKVLGHFIGMGCRSRADSATLLGECADIMTRSAMDVVERRAERTAKERGDEVVIARKVVGES